MKGFAALTIVLIITAISLILGFAIIMLSVGEIKMVLEKTFSLKSYNLTYLCAENALMKLKENIGYSGNEVLDIEGGSCRILPVEGNWIVKIIGNYQDQIKKMKIVVSKVNPKMTIQSWEEVADF